MCSELYLVASIVTLANEICSTFITIYTFILLFSDLKKVLNDPSLEDIFSDKSPLDTQGCYYILLKIKHVQCI